MVVKAGDADAMSIKIDYPLVRLSNQFRVPPIHIRSSERTGLCTKPSHQAPELDIAPAG
jgi:hypothetical protein